MALPEKYEAITPLYLRHWELNKTKYQLQTEQKGMFDTTAPARQIYG
jgi:hypothetical protein